MSNIEAHIKTINDKLQQLIKKYIALKKENENLRFELTHLKEKEINSDLKLEDLHQKIIILKAASGKMSTEDQKEFEKRVNRYIKDIERCIGILSD